jgi:hydrogenase maturation protease
MSLPRPIRIVGCGGPRGDDAAGWAAIDRLRDQLGRAVAGVSLHHAAGGPDILELLDGRGTLILVDAVSSGAAPGTIHRLEWPNPRLITLRPRSSHDLGPVAALDLASVLDRLPPRVILYGLEAAGLRSCPTLTEVVAAALPLLVGDILDEIGYLLVPGPEATSHLSRRHPSRPRQLCSTRR